LARLKAELAQLAEGSNVQLQSLKCRTAGTPPPIDASAELRAQVRTMHFCSSVQPFKTLCASAACTCSACSLCTLVLLLRTGVLAACNYCTITLLPLAPPPARAVACSTQM
jgi:hypothetical protein